MNRSGPIEDFASDMTSEQRDRALLFKKLATLRTNAPLLKKVERLRWRGPTPPSRHGRIGWERRSCWTALKS